MIVKIPDNILRKIVGSKQYKKMRTDAESNAFIKWLKNIK